MHPPGFEEEIIRDYKTDFDLNRLETNFGLSKPQLRYILRKADVFEPHQYKPRVRSRSKAISRVLYRFAQNLSYHRMQSVEEKQIADEIGITVHRYRMIEKGATNPTLFEICRILRYLNIPMEKLIDEEMIRDSLNDINTPAP